MFYVKTAVLRCKVKDMWFILGFVFLFLLLDNVQDIVHKNNGHDIVQ